MKYFLEVKGIQEITKNKKRLITRWVIIWYYLFYAIFFTSWYLYSQGIAFLNPKANGQPFEELGLLMGLIPAFITAALSKVFIYDPLTRKILN